MQEILGKFMRLQFDEIFSTKQWFMHQATIQPKYSCVMNLKDRFQQNIDIQMYLQFATLIGRIPTAHT